MNVWLLLNKGVASLLCAFFFMSLPTGVQDKKFSYAKLKFTSLKVFTSGIVLFSNHFRRSLLRLNCRMYLMSTRSFIWRFSITIKLTSQSKLLVSCKRML